MNASVVMGLAVFLTPSPPAQDIGTWSEDDDLTDVAQC